MLETGTAMISGDEFDVMVTTTPAPPPHANAWRQVISASRMRDFSAPFVLIGDSMAAAFSRKAAALVFGGPSIVNLGINGFRTQHVLWLLQQSEVLKLQPQRILLMIGTNNLSAGDKPGAIAAGTTAIITRIAAIWKPAQIILIQTVPRLAGYAFREPERKQLNVAMLEPGRQRPGLLILDADAVLQNQVRAFCPDHLHLSPFGYELIANRILQAV